MVRGISSEVKGIMVVTTILKLSTYQALCWVVNTSICSRTQGLANVLEEPEVRGLC